MHRDRASFVWTRAALAITLMLFFLTACRPAETKDAATKDAATKDAGSSKLVRTSALAGSLPISSVLPADIPGGAPGATLAQAAAFAWQEFFAVNWPAVPQTGQPQTRGVADTTRPFGNPNGPLVWETYRSKVEIFPGNGPPPGFQQGGDFGFDAAPAYNYLATVPPCSGQTAEAPPWVNLDEVTQIGLDIMYAAVVPAGATPANSDPQRIRFLAKANRVQYAYVAGNGFWNHGGNFYAYVNQFTNSLKTNTVPGAGSVISFPAGTVEVKAAWRMLAPAEDATRFHTTTVRYYENAGTGGTSPTPCYRDAVWGMVALHIIQKTPTAPTFIYATFEQADNILNPANGQPVEDANGTIVNAPAGVKSTTPTPTYTDGYNSATHQPDPTVTIGNQPFCTNHGKQLFYQNLTPGLPKGTAPGAGICINERDFAIPSAVIAANQQAHQTLSAAKAAGPWQFYKLVNVQYRPFNQGDINPADPNAPDNSSTFFLANSVVETNSTLQDFEGALIANGPSAGVKTSFNNAGGPFTNVHVPAGAQYQAFNMGGCMGCHGNAQVAGTDFSFILNFGGVDFPEYPDPPLDGKRSARYLKGFTGH